MTPTARNGINRATQVAVLATTLLGAIWWVSSKAVVTRSEFEDERLNTKASLAGLSTDMAAVKASLARIESLMMQRR